MMSIMKYDFDKEIERRGTHCVKYDDLENRFGRSDLLSLWVADMDFATPDFIIDSLRRRLDHPVMGYPLRREDYLDEIVSWNRYLYGWDIKKEWLTYIPGIVKGIGYALQVFTSPSDKVVIQTPVYHPFRIVPQKNGREVVYNPLIWDGNTYRMDFSQLESLLDGGCKMLILANPHNPGGILWKRDELEKLAEICDSRGVVVISDEIHSEMAHNGAVHIPFASVSDAAARCSVTFMAPSKTFNIAGIVSSYAVVPDENLRKRFFGFLEASEFDAAPIFPVEATLAAYRYGKEWRLQMLDYVWNNVLAVEDALAGCPVKVIRPQASFLIWLDCRELLEMLVKASGSECRDAEAKQALLDDFFVNKARLALNSGMMFSSDGGSEGLGFMRLNVGAPCSVIDEAMSRLKSAIASLNV